MNGTRKIFPGLVATFALAVRASAQSYSIDWYTLDDGGSTSTGSVYSISGTVGQPDAGSAMSGVNYSITGGFWSLFALQSSGDLGIRRGRKGIRQERPANCCGG